VGGSAFIEPKYCDGKRPDAKVFLADDQCSIDASVTHPASPSYCSAAVSPLAVAKLRERLKHCKYDAEAANENVHFYPFVMESFGGIGAEALLFLKKVAQFNFNNSSVNVSGFTLWMLRSLSILLQRGNALIQMIGCLDSRDNIARRALL
jgi:hypothetical protein